MIFRDVNDWQFYKARAKRWGSNGQTVLVRAKIALILR